MSDRSFVGTFRSRGTFRPQAASRSSRAAQNTPLPPRCSKCRLPGVHKIDETFLCDNHMHEKIFRK